jgi:hypothetical protein
MDATTAKGFPPLHVFGVFAMPRLTCLAVIIAFAANALADDKAAPAKGRKYALCIGINEYKIRTLDKLKFAEKDISELAEILHGSGFTVEKMLGSSTGAREATKANIRDRFETILKQVTKDDVLLIALSGHGQQLTLKVNGKDREVPFFCPRDADPRDPNTMIAISGLMDDLTTRGGKANLFLVDACRNVDDRGERSGFDSNRVENLGSGTAAFFACSGLQRAVETDKAGGGHGLFFHFVLEGLRGAPGATDPEGQVTWDGLVPYVKKEVKAAAKVWCDKLPEDQRQVPHLVSNLAADPVLTVPGLELMLAKDIKEVLELSRKGLDSKEFYINNAPRRIGSWKKAAEAGNPNGMFLYARCLMDGQSVVKDLKGAFEWYRKAAELKHSAALNNLGTCYQYANGTTRDPVKAFECYEKAAKSGFTLSQYMAGCSYRDGLGVKANPKAAFDWFTKAAVGGNRNAMNELGICYQNGNGVDKNEKTALEWYKAAARLEHVEAINSVGYMYSLGIGVDRDPKEAAKWYDKAARLGDKFALRNMGLYYGYGISVQQDNVKASEYYLKGAIAGDYKCMVFIGSRYLQALGVPRDEYKAVEWFQKAAKAGNSEGMVCLGDCYLKGQGGLEKNPSMALEWYYKSAKTGDREGMNAVGACYQNGHGVDIDYGKAMDWYLKAADKGEAHAMRNIAYLYYHGKGVEKNDVTCTEWFLKAANAGHADSMNTMGLRTAKGLGIEASAEGAYQWFLKAAQNGNHFGMRNTALYLENGKGVQQNVPAAIKWYKKAHAAASKAGDSKEMEYSLNRLTALGEKP